MSDDEAHSTPIENWILRALEPAEYRRLSPQLEGVSLTFQDRLYEPDKTIEYVHFMSSGVVSMVASMQSGPTVEVATVGNEGMVGIPVFLGSERSPLEAFVQIPGDGFRMPSEAFKREVAKGGQLGYLLHRYTEVLFLQIAQGAACNRIHTIETRCARWLLMTHDRVRSDAFPLKQEFLAQMLGAGRPSVSVAAGKLQSAGWIRYTRGQVTILDRKGLEGAACDCYGIIRREYDRLYSSA